MPIDAEDPDALIPEPVAPPEEPAESPLVTIWESPRETIRYVVATDPRRWVRLLFFASGFVGALSSVPTVLMQWFEIELSPELIVVIAFGAGLFAILTGHLNAWYKRWVGTLFGGDASRAAVVAVSAYTSIPALVGQALVLGIFVALYGEEPFRSTHPAMDAAPPLLTRTLGLITGLSWLWSICLSIVCFADVNRFSIARSIATSLLGLLLIAVSITAMIVAAVIVAPLLMDGTWAQ